MHSIFPERRWRRRRAAFMRTGRLQTVPAELQTACGVLRDHHWHMHEPLRRTIRFERRNLAVEGALETDAKYHLILCRNLFIYLNAEARAMLAESLSRALLPGGRLIVGAGDRIAEVNARFVPVKPAAGFGFVHRTTRSGTKHGATQRVFRRASVRRSAGASRGARCGRWCAGLAGDQVLQARGGVQGARQSAAGGAALPAGALSCSGISARTGVAAVLVAGASECAVAAALCRRGFFACAADMEALAGLTPLGEEAR